MVKTLVRRKSAAPLCGAPNPAGIYTVAMFHIGASVMSLAPTYFFISQSALILLRLLSKSNPLRWASIWFWVQSWKMQHPCCCDVPKKRTRRRSCPFLGFAAGQAAPSSGDRIAWGKCVAPAPWPGGAVACKFKYGVAFSLFMSSKRKTRRKACLSFA